MNEFNKILGSIDWELLKRFNILANSKNFIEAAKTIGTSQSALLKQIDKLEDQLKCSLFIRVAKNRSHNLTEDGKKLLNDTNLINLIISRKVTKDIEDRILSLQDITSQKEIKKKIKIVTTLGLSESLLLRLISNFEKNNKNVIFEIITLDHPVILNLNEIIIRSNFLPQQNLKVENLMKIHSSFYASQGYIDEHGIPQSKNDLVSHNLLSFKYFDVTNTDKITLDNSSELYISPRFYSNNIFFLIGLARLDHGIVELPRFDFLIKDLVEIKTLESNEDQISFAYLNIDKQDPILYKFIDYIKFYVKNLENFN